MSGYCQAVLSSGVNKGRRCRFKAKVGKYCGIHNKLTSADFSREAIEQHNRDIQDNRLAEILRIEVSNPEDSLQAEYNSERAKYLRCQYVAMELRKKAFLKNYGGTDMIVTNYEKVSGKDSTIEDLTFSFKFLQKKKEIVPYESHYFFKKEVELTILYTYKDGRETFIIRASRNGDNLGELINPNIYDSEENTLMQIPEENIPKLYQYFPDHVSVEDILEFIGKILSAVHCPV